MVGLGVGFCLGGGEGVEKEMAMGECTVHTLQLWQWQSEVRASSGEERFTSYSIARQ
jgi:hypothetical protein